MSSKDASTKSSGRKIIKPIIITSIVLALILVPYLSLKAYADWGVKHEELNNTRDIWIGDWQHPFFIVVFHGECYLGQWGVDMGHQQAEFFTSETHSHVCTQDDLTRIDMYSITKDNPYKDSGICDFDFSRQQTYSTETTHSKSIGNEQLTINSEIGVPLHCFVKIDSKTCQWQDEIIGNHTKPNYCDIPNELNKEAFYGLAKYFNQTRIGEKN